jgi:hypothetical protein
MVGANARDLIKFDVGVLRTHQKNLACLLLNAQNDPATQPGGSKTLIRRGSHPPSVSSTGTY